MGQLSIQNLSVNFHSREGIVQAVNDIDLKIKEGEIVGLVGESGSGKSVTCNSVLQLLPCPPAEISQGVIEWDGNDLLKTGKQKMANIRGKEISMIFQDPMSCLNPYLTVLEQVAEPLIIHNLATPKEAMQQAKDILVEVGVDRILTSPNSYPHEFSGGMRQRAMIAMALITKPALLLADEPTTALDVTVQAKILSILKEACLKRKISVLFVSHDLGLVAELADRVVVMYRGKVIEQKDTTTLFQNPEHPYVKALIACRPTLESSSDRLPTVEDFTHPNHSMIRASEQSSLPLHERKVLLETKGLTVEFSSKDGQVRAVNNVNLAIREGTTHGLVGESGSGKTTLGRSILQLTRKTSGQILLHGKPILIGNSEQQLHFRRSMQIIFQDPYASLNPRLTIEQTLIEPMIVHGIGNNKQERKERVVALLEEVGLASEHLSRYPHQFSGGQRQRICVARALTTEPQFIVCDECVSAMDVSVQAQVLNLLKALQESRGLTYLFISHDLGVVKFMSDEISVMQHGTVVETGKVDAIYQHPQSEYTRQLIEAIPQANRSTKLLP
jgi:peptide/nickel transport system ATP-binding protein